jgi:hypothetical protein
MSGPLLEALEMKTENKETKKSDEISEAQSNEGSAAENADAGGAAGEKVSSELELPRWSIVSFEGVTASGLEYDTAVKRMENMKEQHLSGLCIITDEAAARMSK